MGHIHIQYEHLLQLFYNITKKMEKKPQKNPAALYIVYMLYIVCLCIVDYSMSPLTLLRAEIEFNKVN